MGISMMQFLTGLTGTVGLMVCLSITRMVIGLTASITAATVMLEEGQDCIEDHHTFVTMFLLVTLCVHFLVDCIFGTVTVGNLNYSLTADITDWIFNLAEYGMAIHLLGVFKSLNQCIDRQQGVNVSDFAHRPIAVWGLFVCWITVETILFIFRLLISYIIYTKVKAKGLPQRKYVIQ